MFSDISGVFYDYFKCLLHPAPLNPCFTNNSINFGNYYMGQSGGLLGGLIKLCR